MKWLDIYDITAELVDNHPDINPLQINFVDLRDLVLNLPNFADDPQKCNEKILEAIQQAWLDEIQ